VGCSSSKVHPKNFLFDAAAFAYCFVARVMNSTGYPLAVDEAAVGGGDDVVEDDYPYPYYYHLETCFLGSEGCCHQILY